MSNILGDIVPRFALYILFDYLFSYSNLRWSENTCLKLFLKNRKILRQILNHG